MSDYSTRQVATKLRVSHSVLSKYIVTGKIPAPKTVTAGGMTVHLWTDEDVERVRNLLPKIKNGRKTRYKKKQVAISAQSTARRDLRDSAKAKSKTKQPQPRAAHGAPGSSTVPHKRKT